MSWRVLIIFLLFTLVASWQGGKQLGYWLIDQAPESIASASDASKDREQVLDADGKPLAPQPPQPRIDGTLGVPREMEPVEWTITAVIASREDANSYKGDDEDEDADSNDNVDPANTSPDSVRTVDVSAGSKATSGQVATAKLSSAESWQQQLKKELAQCSSVGFFRRPACIEAAQKKYCDPNNARGKIPECPSPFTDTPYGG
jgi:hypothetical protein